MTKARVGRRTETLTEDQLIQFDALAAYLSLDQIAEFFGICRNTLGRIRKDDVAIDARYKAAKQKGTQKVADALIVSALGGNTTAQVFYLKTQAGWKETAITEHAGSVNVTHEDSLEWLK